MRNTYKEFFPDDEVEGKELKDIFVKIVESLALGLGIYESYVRTAKKYIYSDEFKKGVDERYKTTA
ncbi:hypothetical protein ACFLWO_03475 [Chloroflexota bacterium]